MTWANFTHDEFACKCGCGRNEMRPEVVDVAQELRDLVGFALPVSSGYRCDNHPVERRKSRPGMHALGLAVDFAVSHQQARILLEAALQHEKVTGIGVNQKGDGRFVHIDIGPDRKNLIWTY